MRFLYGAFVIVRSNPVQTVSKFLFFFPPRSCRIGGAQAPQWATFLEIFDTTDRYPIGMGVNASTIKIIREQIFPQCDDDRALATRLTAALADTFYGTPLTKSQKVTFVRRHFLFSLRWTSYESDVLDVLRADEAARDMSMAQLTAVYNLIVYKLQRKHGVPVYLKKQSAFGC